MKAELYLSTISIHPTHSYLNFVFNSGDLKLSIIAQHDMITVIEHPVSLLVPLNATAEFSCSAQCTPRPCTFTGQWLANNSFHPLVVDRDQNELTLYLKINNLEFRNDVSLQCFFEYNDIHNGSGIATLEWIDGEL